ncbi:L,D-transpeptidase [Halomonas piscis]|uniref:L,D-transpeptidase n=1 Tax=Halomonas piscis TaxID=3031727 RepID=A0ABY9YV99_9GAMM|nr:L,D-transpeptidase [Halomonas piscis]WNK18794.1 L,D-transpeptidase [Halomonas piscis]
MRTPKLHDLPPADAPWLEIDLARQRLVLWHGRVPGEAVAVSTGKAGAGQQDGSGQTPLGWHYVRAAVGENAPREAVFRGRRPTGEVYSEALARAHPGRDWILGRILWLCGLESGRNRGGRVDTQRRYIYLHGTPPSEPMGVAQSHGCVRLRLDDLIKVFAQTPPGTPVWLHGGDG